MLCWFWEVLAFGCAFGTVRMRTGVVGCPALRVSSGLVEMTIIDMLLARRQSLGISRASVCPSSLGLGPPALRRRGQQHRAGADKCKALSAFVGSSARLLRKAAGFCGGKRPASDRPLPLASSVPLWVGSRVPLQRLLLILFPKRGIACWVNRVRRSMGDQGLGSTTHPANNRMLCHVNSGQ